MNDTYGGNTIGAKVPDHRYTRKQAAKIVGRSVDTLMRWHRQGICVPSDKMQAGELSVWLYTEKDIARLMTVASVQKPGRRIKHPTTPEDKRRMAILKPQVEPEE